MRIVITGATGNVGTNVIEHLGSEPQVESILGLVRRLPAWEPAKTTWAKADIATSDLEPHFRGADVVVHLAWIFQPTHDELTTWRINVLGGMRVFDAVAAAGVPALVYASSVGAYSPGGDAGPVDETWPTHALPIAAYGREKSYLERVLDTFELQHPDIRVVRMRPGFIFERESASEQRRLFAGPLLPGSLVRSQFVPVVPDLPGLQLQVLHADDAAEAYRLAILRDVRGAFNIAADPVLDAERLAEVFNARVVKMPAAPVRTALATAWRLHLVPASPTLLDLALSLPVMNTSRARTELGWTPTVTALDALREVIQGMRERAGKPTPPLAPGAGGRFRQREFRSGVGGRPEP